MGFRFKETSIGLRFHELRVQGLGFRAQGLEMRVYGLEFRA